MVDFDPANEAAGTKLTVLGGKPTIKALKKAIEESEFAARYTPEFMYSATKNDLIHVCRLHGIPVAGLPGVPEDEDDPEEPEEPEEPTDPEDPDDD